MGAMLMAAKGGTIGCEQRVNEKNAGSPPLTPTRTRRGSNNGCRWFLYDADAVVPLEECR